MEEFSKDCLQDFFRISKDFSKDSCKDVLKDSSKDFLKDATISKYL